jgi:hypothetical protein
MLWEATTDTTDTTDTSTLADPLRRCPGERH